MLIEKELINKLRNIFDLNQYEVAIWVNLISKGVSTAGQLSDLSNVPRSRAYDVLESLEKKGFVVIKIGKPIQYIAVPPEEVINRVQKRVMISAEEKVKQLSNLKESDLIKQVNDLYENGIRTYSPTELSGAFRGRQNIYDQIESMIRKAQSNVKIVTTEEGMIRKLSVLKNVIKKTNERRVKIQVKSLVTEKNRDEINKLSGLVEFKESTENEARYVIVDDQQALLLLLNDAELNPNYDVGIWVNSESISKVLGKQV